MSSLTPRFSHQAPLLFCASLEHFVRSGCPQDLSQLSYTFRKETEETLINPLPLLLLRTFLQWQVVTGMEAEQIIESLTNYT